MTDPPEPQRRESLLFRVVRSAIAPDVLEDGGRDAPISRRGRILFGAVVALLVAGIAVLFLVTASSR